jgi:hypothetical protein
MFIFLRDRKYINTSIGEIIFEKDVFAKWSIAILEVGSVETRVCNFFKLLNGDVTADKRIRFDQIRGASDIIFKRYS